MQCSLLHRIKNIKTWKLCGSAAAWNNGPLGSLLTVFFHQSLGFSIIAKNSFRARKMVQQPGHQSSAPRTHVRWERTNSTKSRVTTHTSSKLRAILVYTVSSGPARATYPLTCCPVPSERCSQAWTASHLNPLIRRCRPNSGPEPGEL